MGRGLTIVASVLLTLSTALGSMLYFMKAAGLFEAQWVSSHVIAPVTS